MHRRGIGVGAIKNKSAVQARYKDKGSEIASEQMGEMSKQMEVFRKNLEEFATKHREEIRKNPQFRSQFQEMCAAIGVDPLASSKGFWSKMLGVGDFYYELGVQIIEVCIATSHRNGGLMGLDELRQRLTISRGRNKQEICKCSLWLRPLPRPQLFAFYLCSLIPVMWASVIDNPICLVWPGFDDILMAVRKLKALGNGFMVISIGNGKHLVQSVPGELTMDHLTLLQQAEGQGYVSQGQLKEKLGWEDERITRALDYMVSEGLAWIDDQARLDRQFWFPGLFADTSLPPT